MTKDKFEIVNGLFLLIAGVVWIIAIVFLAVKIHWAFGLGIFTVKIGGKNDTKK